MSCDPLKVIDVLMELPGVPEAVVSAVTARIVFKESIETRELLKVLEECGLSPEQAMALRKSLQRGTTAASTSSPASASLALPSAVHPAAAIETNACLDAAPVSDVRPAIKAVSVMRLLLHQQASLQDCLARHWEACT